MTGVSVEGRHERLLLADPRVDGARVAFDRRTDTGLSLVEWYVNGQLGVQQGFTIPAPHGRPVSRLGLRLDVDDEWRVRVDADGRRARFGGRTRSTSVGCVDEFYR